MASKCPTFTLTICACLTGSDDEDDKRTRSEEDKKVDAAAATVDNMCRGNKAAASTVGQLVVSRLEVVNSMRSKAKRKRRKSWTGPAASDGDGGVGPCRKGHSLDQGYGQHHYTLFRSFSSNAADPTADPSAAANGAAAAGRQFRTPSVVVSDHSEDPVSFSSMFTLDDLDELEPRPDCGFNDSSSDCSAASTWSAAGSVISMLDCAEYALHTPERKVSGCSTCSGDLSDEDAAPAYSTAAEAIAAAVAAMPVRSKPKVSASHLYAVAPSTAPPRYDVG